MAIYTKFIAISRKLRKNQTPREKKLWMYLKNRRFEGIKFKRQVVLGLYVYDFASFEKKLIIELDGSQHKAPENLEKDAEKQVHAEKLGYKVLRFNNSDLEFNLEGVLEYIKQAMA